MAVWGPLEGNLIIGKAFMRLFPVEKIDVLPGAYSVVEEQPVS